MKKLSNRGSRERFHELPFSKQMVLAVKQILLFDLFILTIFGAIAYYLRWDNIDILPLLYIFITTSVIIYAIRFYYFKSPVRWNFNLVWYRIADFLYYSFVSFSSLCFTRINISIPLTFKEKANHKDDSPISISIAEKTNAELSDHLVNYLNLEFLYTFPMYIVLAFIAFRLLLNTVDEIPQLKHKVKHWKDIWKNTMICWAAIFTILTTIASLWADIRYV